MDYRGLVFDMVTMWKSHFDEGTQASQPAMRL